MIASKLLGEFRKLDVCGFLPSIVQKESITKPAIGAVASRHTKQCSFNSHLVTLMCIPIF
ncbi:hypothetical protein [Leptospira levettii]|uniref:hypothetical protein n=1 Tax=Leptospira levettii TaxID=2023178 RepID=UPI00108334EF|nr:hypothetical protein [Leptospira levettii]TGM85812.1 hypothetical protein EHR00_02555 [Leptospira levettii]